MGYKQNFGPSRKGAKHGKDMISRIMSNTDTASPLDNSVQHLKGMKGAKDGTKGSGMYRKSYMKGDSYAVPADKLKSIQKSEGLSRKGSKPDYIDIDGDGDKKESMKSASKGISREGSDPKPKTEKKVRSNPSEYFKSFPTKKQQKSAKNPYPKESVNYRAFASLQKNLKDSSF